MKRDVSITKDVKNGCKKEMNKVFFMCTGDRASSNGLKLQ